MISPMSRTKKNSKARLKKIADAMGQDIGAIEYQLLYWFIKQKNSDYTNILAMLRGIIESQTTSD